MDFLKKTLKTTANVLLYAFIAISILGILLTITSKKDNDGTATLFGIQIRYVISPSMEKNESMDYSDFTIKDIPVKSMVFIDVVPEDEEEAKRWYSDLKVGDVVTFKYVYVKQDTITHRITRIEPKSDGGYIISLAGDNRESEADVQIQTIDTSLTNSPNYIIGKVVAVSYPIGLFIGALKSPVGIVCVIIIPSFIILNIEIFKMVRILGADKKKKATEEKERQQNELDELRRRLAELEANRSGEGNDAKDSRSTDFKND